MPKSKILEKKNKTITKDSLPGLSGEVENNSTDELFLGAGFSPWVGEGGGVADTRCLCFSSTISRTSERTGS